MDKQLSLFDAQPSDAEIEHQIVAEPVPEHLALEPGRVRIVILKRIKSKGKRAAVQTVRFPLAVQ